MKISVKLLILFIIVGGIAAVANNLGWLEQDDAPDEIKDQIKALGNRSYEITSIRDDGEIYKIRLRLHDIPAASVIENWATSVCKEIRSILREESVTRDIEVSVYANLLGGQQQEYGECYYDHDRFSYSYTMN